MIGVVSQLIRPSSDQLLVKVHLDEMDSFVFALATKKTAARLSKEMTDIVSVLNRCKYFRENKEVFMAADSSACVSGWEFESFDVWKAVK